MTKLNIFIHHRDLRIIDNTTLIEQDKNESDVIPIFIFPPEQINPKKNTYICICKWDLSKETLGEQSIETQEEIYTLLISNGIYETTN